MKTPAACLAALLALSPALSQGARAQGAGFEDGTPVRVTGIDAGSTLNLRQGPGTANPVLGTLAPGQTGVTVLYCEAGGAWCRVRSLIGGDGWVASAYLERDGEAVVPVPDASPPPAWHAAFPPDTPHVITGIDPASALNVRAGPGTGNPVLTRLPAGRGGLDVRDCTEALDWCEIGEGGASLGWVSARYLGTVADAPPAPTRETGPPRPAGEATRLAAALGRDIDPEAMITLPELPPYLLGAWDVGPAACARAESDTRIGVLENGLSIGAATARFKTAIFRGDGYDLTTLLMQEEDILNAVPQRALYRLQPEGEALVLSGDVLEERRLVKCGG